MVAERLRVAIEKSGFDTPEGRQGFTVSIGVAESSQAGGGLEGLIAAADKELYVAKTTGRNKVSRSLAQAAGDGKSRWEKGEAAHLETMETLEVMEALEAKARMIRRQEKRTLWPRGTLGR